MDISNSLALCWGQSPTYGNNKWFFITLPYTYSVFYTILTTQETTTLMGDTTWKYPATCVPGGIKITLSQIKIGGRYTVANEQAHYTFLTIGH